MIDSVVSISGQAFFSIVTSALEAYKLEHVLACGGRKNVRAPVGVLASHSLAET